MSKYFLLITISFFTSHLFAQPLTEKDYEKYPYWVAMINDSTANFFEA